MRNILELLPIEGARDVASFSTSESEEAIILECKMDGSTQLGSPVVASLWILIVCGFRVYVCLQKGVELCLTLVVRSR